MMFWIDGQLVEPTTEELQLLDPSSPNTFGVFETLRTYNGKIFELNRHLQRLEHSAELIGMDLPCSLKQIEKYLQKSLQENKEKEPLRIKCIATQEHIYIQILPLWIDPAIYEGVKAILIARKRPHPEAKSLPYYSSYSAHALAQKKGAYEAILVDEEGHVTEGAYSNIFWVKGQRVFTRKDSVLEGITRAVVKELIPVEWGKIKAEALLKADEVFLTKSTTGPVPIISIDGVQIAEGKIGQRTRELIQLFNQNL